MSAHSFAAFAAKWLATPMQFDEAQIADLLALPPLDEPTLAAVMPPLPAEALAHAAAADLLRQHQFVELPPRAIADLARLFRGVVEVVRTAKAKGMTADGVRDALRPHLDALTAWPLGHVEADAPAVVCGEYSAALQMDVLGFATWQLMAPLLDLGCGAHAYLVRHLRNLGWDAHGLDRLAPPDVQLANAPPFSTWLACTLPPAAFATITSHMAFSLNFLHHHVRAGGGGVALRYADTYRHILLALRPGGHFVYAPSLPFVEASLPAGYSVRYAPLPSELASGVAALSRATGADVAQAACVTREAAIS
ncbi:MAG: class I SAM-dependent methyltransferase [Myxococcales bacterium]|nr:class I SAM-dependent methyltransferase [Myxococcales bacterium]